MITNVEYFNDLKLIRRYDVEQDVWTPIAPFPGGVFHRSQHASARFQNVILVSGGLRGDHHDLVLDTILVYHPNNDIWETDARRMPTPRAGEKAENVKL
jgi:N-acetylneuraminic acid mutarotase